MKLSTSDITAYLKNPKAYQAVLIYGPDEGLVRNRRDAILKSMNVSKNDPFAYMSYDYEPLMDEPALLYEALSATTLMGDAPVVCIGQVADKLTEHVKAALQEIKQPNPLIIMAGDLQKTSSLRAFFEDAKSRHYASIPCYRDDGASLSKVVDSFLQSRGITAQSSVKELLRSQLGNDRAVTLSELNKLDVYLGSERRLTEDDVLNLLANNQHRMGSDALLDGLCGNYAQFFSHYDALIAAGEQPIALLRIMGGIVQKLLEAKHMQQAEKLSANTAIEKLRPQIFFKDKTRYATALNKYSMKELLKLLQQIQDAELHIKHGTVHPEMIISEMMIARG